MFIDEDQRLFCFLMKKLAKLMLFNEKNVRSGETASVREYFHW